MAMDLSLALQIDLLMDRNIGSGFKGLDNALKATADKVKELSSVAQKSSGLAEMAGKFQEVSAKTEGAKTQLAALQERSAYIDTCMQTNASHAERLASRYEVLKTEQHNLELSGDKGSAAYKRVSDRMKQLKAEMKGTKDEGRRLSQMQKELASESTGLEKQVNADTAALQKMQGALESAGVDVKNLASEQARLTEQSARVQAAQERLANAQNRLKGIKDQLNWGNIKGDLMAGIASMGALKVPVQTDMQFEQAMANVRAVTGSDDEEFAKLRSQAMDLGASTQFSATQAANTQEALSRAGMKANTVMAVIPSVLSMAAADGMDLAAAGSILSDTLGGMGVDMEKLTEKEAQRYADVLANSSAMGNTNITEIGEAMKVAAPVAGSQGMSIEQLGAYLAAMANKGLKGSEAGQAIVGGMNRIALSPKETKAALKELGVKTKTKSGQMVELPEIMRQINAGFEKKKLGASDQLKYMDKIFGQNYGKSMMGFLSASASGDVDRLVERNRTEAQAGRGKAAEMAFVRNDTLQGDITALGSAWEGLLIQTGNALEPISRFITQTLTEGIQKVTQFMKEHEVLCNWIVKIGAGFMTWRTVGTVYKYGSLLCQLPFAKMSAMLAQGAADAAVSGQKFSALGSVFSGLMTPVKALWSLIMAHPFVAIGAAVAGAAVLIWQNWDKIKETAEKCWSAIKEYAGAASEWISAKWQGLAEWWNSLSFGDVFAPVKEYAQKFSSWLSSTFEMPDIFASLSETASQAIESVKGLFSSLGDWIMETIGKLNPFNWEMPSWLGGGQTPAQTQARHDRGQSALQSAFGAPSFEVHAAGGILTRPHMGLVAEAGPEAVIPLSDRGRGLEVLAQAAEILGVRVTGGEESGGVKELSERYKESSSSALSLYESAGLTERAERLFETEQGGTLREVMTSGGITTNSYGDRERTYNASERIMPEINITVNASGNDSGDDLAARIARAVSEAWEQIQERQERLSYA